MSTGNYNLTRLDGGFHLTPIPGIAHCNVTKVAFKGRPVNPLDIFELSYGELEGRRQIREYERFFRDYVPGFEKAHVTDVGNNLGIREARRLTGDYTLTREDVVNCRHFEDAIACSAWPLEIHGSGAMTTWEWIKPGYYYQIPLRSLFNSECGNLLVAGRCISVSHDAQASIRVSGVCLATGEAAGTAAGMMSSEGKNITELSVNELQDRLRIGGAFLG